MSIVAVRKHGAEMVFGRFQSQSASVHTHNALRNIQDGGICETGYGGSNVTEESEKPCPPFISMAHARLANSA